MKQYIDEIDTSLLNNAVLNPAWALNSHPIGDIQKIVVHHEATFADTVYEDVPRYENEANYQNNHSIPGSLGLQYHYKIDNVGQIFQVRPLTTYLWHCGDFIVNQHSIAICLDGNFELQLPTREQFEALQQLLHNLTNNHPEFPAVEADVYPHRAFFATACPGANLFGFVDDYRKTNGAVAIPDVPYQHPELQPLYVAPVAPTVVPQTPVEVAPSLPVPEPIVPVTDATTALPSTPDAQPVAPVVTGTPISGPVDLQVDSGQSTSYTSGQTKTPVLPVPEVVLPLPVPPINSPISDKSQHTLTNRANQAIIEMKDNLMKNFSQYNKAIAAAIGFALTALNVLYGSNPWVQLAIAAATLAGVYHTKNSAPAPVL